MSEATIDRDELRTMANRLLDDLSASAAVRALVDPPAGAPDDAAWRRLWGRLAEVGWPGIAIAEEHGGAGAAFGDLAVVLGELGAHLTPTPLFASAVLGAGVLTQAGTAAQQAMWLPRLGAGSAIGTAAVPTLGTRATARVSPDGDALLLDGTWQHVPDADSADVIALPAVDDGRDLLVLVPGDTPGLTRTPVPMADLTRRFATVHADGVRLPADAVLCAGDSATRVLDMLRDRAALAVACDSLGLADRLLKLTTTYVAQRVQFDRPVGSFQAVKHDCTDMLIAVETARVVVADAVRALDSHDPGVATAVAMAKSYATDAGAEVAAAAVTLHGGIGFTWEHDAHLYLKRAKLNQALYGSSRAYRRRIADLEFGPAALTPGSTT